MGTRPRTVSTPPTGDEWVPGLGQPPPPQEMNGYWPRTVSSPRRCMGTWPRKVSTPPTGYEWVTGLGQYLPLLQEMNGYLA